MVFNNMKYLSKRLPYKTSVFMHDYYKGLKSMQRNNSDIRVSKHLKQKPRHRRVSKLLDKERLPILLLDGKKNILNLHDAYENWRLG